MKNTINILNDSKQFQYIVEYSKGLTSLSGDGVNMNVNTNIKWYKTPGSIKLFNYDIE
jgi:hypothetical protein